MIARANYVAVGLLEEWWGTDHTGVGGSRGGRAGRRRRGKETDTRLILTPDTHLPPGGTAPGELAEVILKSSDLEMRA